jgi:RNA polymerase subunit RPABC4/transcription elongation factor Spt4
MERRIFHGNITPTDIAQALLAEFNRGNLRTQMFGESNNLTVQIATRQGSMSGGQTALAVNIQQLEDGVMLQIGKQQWLGTAASLGATAIAVLRNPFNLIGRLDDIAQDVENLSLTEKVFQVVGNVVRAAGASHELSDRLNRLACEFCGTANPVGEPNCVACGAPLGKAHPTTCPQCGFVVSRDETTCPNCGKAL